MNEFAPIIVFVYKRLRHTQQTIESLIKNNLSEKSDLFVFSDGAKSDKSENNVKEVRNYIKTIEGFKSVRIIEREKNFGLAGSIVTGVTEIINKYGKVIVLEDDMIVSPYFLQYMNETLNFYEKEDKVISVHAYVYPVREKLPNTFFIKGADCWGWGTWQRGWELFENDTEKLLKEIKKRNLENDFDFNGSINNIRMLNDQLKGRIDSWAIRWNASAFLKDKLTLYPGRSLVKNIGSGGTHVHSTEVFDAGLSQQPVEISKIEIEENKEARKAFENYFRSIKPGFISRGIRRVKDTLRKNYG
jgi:hypothetical protein